MVPICQEVRLQAHSPNSKRIMRFAIEPLTTELQTTASANVIDGCVDDEFV